MPKIETLAEFLGVDAPGEPFDVERTPLSIKDFCKGVLESREYRRSLLQRIQLGELPPAIEARLYDYAYGKPVERVEHAGPNGAPIETVKVVRVIVDPQVDPDVEKVLTSKEIFH